MFLSTRLPALALLALGVALPTPVPLGTVTKVSAIPSFNVTGFTAGAVVLSHRVYYNFNVTFCLDLPSVSCSFLGTSLSEELSTTPLTKCGTDALGFSNAYIRAEAEDEKAPNVAFKWTRQGDGTSNLLITRAIGVGGHVVEEAEYVVPADHTPNVGEGRFRHMVYDGPENFSVPAFRFETC